jgi:hypothetical protein
MRRSGKRAPALALAALLPLAQLPCAWLAPGSAGAAPAGKAPACCCESTGDTAGGEGAQPCACFAVPGPPSVPPATIIAPEPKLPAACAPLPGRSVAAFTGSSRPAQTITLPPAAPPPIGPGGARAPPPRA